MTKHETVQIMAYIEAAYPSFYARKTREERAIAVNLWEDQLGEFPYPVVMAAVRSAVAAGGQFPPAVGEIKSTLRNLTRPDEMTASEAWAIISRAASNSAYPWDAKEQFDLLPPVLKRLVGSPDQLCAWARMSSEYFESVIGSNIMKSFREVQKRERFIESLPSDVRALLSGIARRLDMDRKNLLEEGYDGKVKAE